MLVIVRIMHKTSCYTIFVLRLMLLWRDIFGADAFFQQPVIPYTKPRCHKTFTEPEGVITSPGYPNGYSSSLQCFYDIARGNETSCGIRITIEDLDLKKPDRDGFCKVDWVSVDSCVPEGGSRFCGRMTSPTSYDYPFQQSSKFFRLVFRTGNANTHNYTDYHNNGGFRIRYKILSDCRHGLYWNPPISTIPGVFKETQDQAQEEILCFTQVTEKKGTINTPFFPKHYPNRMDCVYEFLRESPVICGIRMRVITFDLEHPVQTEIGGACVDFFHLIGGCGFLCGNLKFTWIAKYQPSATSMKFHFHSDELKTRPGFQIAFEQLRQCN